MTKILIVDDEPAIRTVFMSFFRYEGYEGYEASDGLEALEIAKKIALDVVISDIKMSRMDGLAFLDQVKKLSPLLPVIICTGHGDYDSAKKALNLGAVNYLEKPVSLNQMQLVLNKIISPIKMEMKERDVGSHLTLATTELAIPSDIHLITGVGRFLTRDLYKYSLMDEESISQVTYAVIEAVSNAIEHGNLAISSELRDDKQVDKRRYFELLEERGSDPEVCDRNVYIRSEVKSGFFKVVIEDEGCGFDHKAVSLDISPEMVLESSGRGIFLMRTFMTSVTYNEKGNQVTMIWRKGV